MRYSGQEHTVTIKYLKTKDNLSQIKNNFHLAHEKNYTFSLDDTEIEMVSYKLVAIMDIGKTKISKINKFIQGNNISYRKVKFINHGILKTQILKEYKPVGIFNLAAETHVDRSIDKPKNFIFSNILGTYNLLEAILSYKKKNKNYS